MVNGWSDFQLHKSEWVFCLFCFGGEKFQFCFQKRAKSSIKQQNWKCHENNNFLFKKRKVFFSKKEFILIIARTLKKN